MIQFEHVSKRYVLGGARGSLRERLGGLPRALLRRPESASGEVVHHWALRNVSFEVSRGEALGIIGRNGAGKTTALKLLSKITRPTTGNVAVDGRVAALIELGAGFHPDLSGHDNVFLYGTILGLSRAEIERRFDEIVEFAELDAFIDVPVKRYSSGMYARLAFAVAAHTYPDVLLVDEVLSVGDSNFRDKCLAFIHSFVNGGSTTVFVSHDMYAVEQLCDRLVWLEHGKVMATGNPSRTLEQYLNFLDKEAATNIEEPRSGQHTLKVIQVKLSDGENQKQVFSPGEDLVVSVEYDTDRVVERPHFVVWVSDTPAPEPLFAANMLVDGHPLESIDGRGSIRCVFKNLPLMPRVYYVWVEAWGADRADILYRWQRLASFHVVDGDLLSEVGSKPGEVHFTKRHAPIRVAYEWQTGDCTATSADRRNGHG